MCNLFLGLVSSKFLCFYFSGRFDVKGYVSGFGHPDWIRTHEAAASTSPVVSVLVEGGATCVGKTVVGEFTFRFVLSFHTHVLSVWSDSGF